MTVEELGQQVKSQYPEYSKYPDSVIGNRFLIKHPERQSGIEDYPSRRENIEPGVMGETDPTGQKILENAAAAGGGYVLPSTINSVVSIPSKVKSILGESEVPFLKSLGKNTSELGKEYDAQNQAIGVVRRVPVEGGMKPKVPIHGNPSPGMVDEVVPTQYPRNTGAFLNYANAKLAGLGDKINPQELMDWQVKLQTDLNSGAIPKFDQTTGRITTVYQQASDLLSRTKSLFNKVAEPILSDAELPTGVMPTREGLNKAFGYSADQEALLKGLKKAGKWGLLTALGLGGGSAILKKFGQP